MVHLVHFFAPDDPDAKRLVVVAKLKLRASARSFFALSPVSMLVASDLSASALADRIQVRSPGVEVIVMRVRNSWQAFGQPELVDWLQEVGDEF